MLLILPTYVFCVIIKWVTTPEQLHRSTVVRGTISNMGGYQGNLPSYMGISPLNVGGVAQNFANNL